MNDVKIKSVRIKPIQSEEFNEDRFLINIVYIVNETDIHKLSKTAIEKPFILNEDPLEIRIYETLSILDLDEKGNKVFGKINIFKRMSETRFEFLKVMFNSGNNPDTNIFKTYRITNNHTLTCSFKVDLVTIENPENEKS